MDKKAVSDALEEAAVLMELSGDNPFRIRAYHNASRIIRAYAGDLAAAVADGSIRSIKGIGPNIVAHVRELLESDDPPFLAELRSRFPAGLLEMLRIPGLGPRKIRVLMDELNITSVESWSTRAGKTGSSIFPVSGPRPRRTSSRASRA